MGGAWVVAAAKGCRRLGSVLGANHGIGNRRFMVWGALVAHSTFAQETKKSFDDALTGGHRGHKMTASTDRNRCDHQLKGINQMATITPKEFAAKVGSDGRTVRKFLRSEQGMNAKVGKGQRWTIEAKQVASLTKRFNKWIAAKAPESPTTD